MKDETTHWPIPHVHKLNRETGEKPHKFLIRYQEDLQQNLENC
jgi:hypothetical protein